MSTDATSDPTAGMSEAEAAQWYLEHRNEVEGWDWEPPVPVEPASPARKARDVMSVRFRAGELAVIAAAAEREGMKVGTYIRAAALRAAQAESLPPTPPALELLDDIDALQHQIDAIRTRVAGPNGPAAMLSALGERTGVARERLREQPTDEDSHLSSRAPSRLP